jgi:hypothetical protein
MILTTGYLVIFSILFVTFGQRIYRKNRFLLFTVFPVPVSLNSIGNISIDNNLYEGYYIPGNSLGGGDFLIVLPMLLAIPFLITELKGMLSGDLAEIHFSYLYERTFFQNYYFIHILFIFISILILYANYESIKLPNFALKYFDRKDVRNLNVLFLKNNRRFLILFILLFSILIYFFSNSQWYEANPLFGAILFIFIATISYFIVFCVIFKIPNRLIIIASFCFMILFMPNISASYSCLRLNSSFEQINFKYPIIKPNIAILPSAFHFLFLNNCRPSKRNFDSFYSKIRNTEIISVMYGCFYLMFIIFCQFNILRRKLHALK